MRAETKKYVLSCNPCQRRKAATTRRQGLTRPLPISEKPFDVVGIDLLTCLPRSSAGYNSILVCTDNLTKYAVTVPLRHAKAENITYAFFTYFIAIYGCPKAVLADRGSNISTGAHVRNFFKTYGVKQFRTSAYHPQTNGQTERFNRTLNTALTIYTDREKKNWSDYLAAFTFGYNISPHAVTHVCPFELIFGFRPRIPLDNWLGRNEFVNPLGATVDVRTPAAIEMMKEAIRATQQRNKKRIDERRTPTTFKEGDLVLFERPFRVKEFPAKLTFKYSGPYKITKKISDLSFEIKGESDSTDKVTSRVVHPRALKLYRERPRCQATGSDPTEVPPPNPDPPVPPRDVDLASSEQNLADGLADQGQENPLDLTQVPEREMLDDFDVESISSSIELEL